MSEYSWDCIFIETSIDSYLSIDDIVELSLASKFLRTSLFQALFNKINFHKLCKFNYFNSFISGEEIDPSQLKVTAYKAAYDNALFNDFDINDLKYFYNPFKDLTSYYKADRNNFKTRLQVYKRQLKSLFMREIDDYFHILYEMPSLFSNLRSLTFSSSTLPLNLCQYLFNNLIHLKSLTLVGCKFLQSSINPIQLKFPRSIEKLTLGYCHIQYILNNSDPIPYLLGEGLLLETSEFPLSPLNIPKLESLTFFGFLGSYNNILDFLRLNPQIKRLFLEGTSLTYKVIELLSSRHILSNLTMISDFNLRLEDESETIQIPSLETIRNLETCLPIKSVNLHQLPIIFPQITSLTLNVDLAKFYRPSDQLLSITSQFANFIPNFYFIQKLVINFYWINSHIGLYFSKRIPKSQELEIFTQIFSYILEHEHNFKNLNVILFRVKNLSVSFKGNLPPIAQSSRNHRGWKIKGYPQHLIIYK
ncbi:hypothetical protein CONCODRAFT_10156 [Conidiobolus coronatus NRRL 28638]|uniref:F-box domain-containing protein n=1 Tax=Conidiobolus coronatus (strain ATCC 28846 / CBS 209.66 / NRRL 28638) TaxID=796925 RepID=A0A137NY51_CONC2|nr:hypothetical protein CONCODRAFT_10156 [Conidiobolus coronatus NRRL 28638]|eukprot:KXN67706.1 hypothetical protein CONCODRAFT_10156 [Conidiobolus coronatus NRRL 28638]